MLEDYNIIREKIIIKHPIQFEQTSIMASCDIMLSKRFIPHLSYSNLSEFDRHLYSLKDGDRIFIDCHTNGINELLDYFFKKTENKKFDFVVWVEPYIDNNFLKKLLPHTNEMYLTNSRESNPNIHNMPLGLRLDSLENINKLLKQDIKKEYLCLLGFQYTHAERHHCHSILGSKEFILNLNDITFDERTSEVSYNCFFCKETKHEMNINCPVIESIQERFNSFNIEEINKYKEKLKQSNLKIPNEKMEFYRKKSFYMLHPSGAGEACHSFWESIILDCIPIVKRTNTNYDKLYEIFPCLVINNWEEVTKEILEANKEALQQKIFDFKQNHYKFFTDVEYMFDFIKKNL